MFVIERNGRRYVAHVDHDGVTGVDVYCDGKIIKSEMFRAEFQACDFIYND